MEYYWVIKNRHGFSWWPSGWKSAWQCGAHRFDPWSGRIPTCCRATKPICHDCWSPCTLEPVLSNKGQGNETPTCSNEDQVQPQKGPAQLLLPWGHFPQPLHVRIIQLGWIFQWLLGHKGVQAILWSTRIRIPQGAFDKHESLLGFVDRLVFAWIS